MFEKRFSNFGVRSVVLVLGSWIFFGLLLGSMCFAQLPEQEERTWVNSTGKHQVVATLVEFENGIAVLLKDNGAKVKLSLAQLSAADQQYLKSLATTPPTTGSETPSPPKNPPSPDTLGESNGSSAAEMTPKTGEGSPADSPGEVDPAPTPKIDLPTDTLSGSSLVQMLQERRIPAARKQLTELLENWPAKPTPGLIAAVTKASESDDKFARKLAITILSKHHDAGSLPAFIRLMDDASFEVRWAAYAAIEKLNDDRALDALIERFGGENSGRIGSILETYGSRAEEKLTLFLAAEHPKNVRLSALSLLAKIGTEKSIPAIEQVEAEAKDVSTRIQAQSAIKKIGERKLAEQQAQQQTEPQPGQQP
jgi:hypothetical protein